MRNVARKITPWSLLVILLLLVSADADAITFFSVRTTESAEPPSEMRPVSAAIPVTIPAGPIWAPILATVIHGGELDGNVPFADLASTHATGADAPEVHSLSSKIGGLGGLTMPSVHALQTAMEGAKLALGTATALLAQSKNKGLSENEANHSLYSLRLPVGAWPQGSFFDSGDLDYQYAATAEVGSPDSLMAANNSELISTDRQAAWKELDKRALEYTYSLQFVGYGILHNDGPVFVTWAIAHAVHISNILNNKVIDELEILSTYPKSKVRDDKIHSLLAYVKNANLHKINGWLAMLRDGLLEEDQETQSK